MSKIKSGILTGVLICLPLTAGIETASARGGHGAAKAPLDPLSIPKFVTELVIPPVLYDDKTTMKKKGKKDGYSVDFVVAQRQIKQQVLPPGFPETTLWAYGNPRNPSTFFNPSYTLEVTKDNNVGVAWVNELVKNPEKCFNNADYNFSIGGGKGKNNQNRNRKRGDACKFLPHIIQDKFGTPVIDQTLHWAAPNQECRDGVPRPDCRGASAEPYLGPVPMVVHVHGAHVGPGSDGYPEAWWLPAASNIPNWYATNGTFFESAEGADTANALGKGYAIDLYSNDQPTATLWYHDHTLGMTRNNVYAAGAGFWLIRDKRDRETGLVRGKLPGPAPKLGQDPNCSAEGKKGKGKNKCVRQHIREIPIAIQGKSFYTDGSQFYPSDRAFFEELGAELPSFEDMGGPFPNTGDVFARNAGLNIPFMPEMDMGMLVSDIAPVWNPEAFFNTMVVNGRTWPKLEVASERYRFRLVNAADSRFLNMALFEVVDAGTDGIMGTADDTLGDELPFYQIGSEQGLLPEVVRIETGFATPLPGNGRDVGKGLAAEPGRWPEQALLMGPAERADVIVDFSHLPDGTVVRMINTGPDDPFGGFDDPPPLPDLDSTYSVMQFVVNTKLNQKKDRSTPAARLKLNKRQPAGAPRLGPDTVPPQDLALLEEDSSKICVEINTTTGAIFWVPGDPVGSNLPVDGCPQGGDAFGPREAVLGVNGSLGGTVQLWDDPIAQNPQLGDVQTWELYNWSADGHPIHLHLVKFQVVNRQTFGEDAAGNAVLEGAPRGPEPWERGWKDTVNAYPGEVTRIKAKFDVRGLYVWHCHILSHEDNEMMVPYCVGEMGKDCPAELFM